MDDKYFLDLSRKIGREWKTLALNLGFDEAEIEAFEADHQGNLQEQVRRMLVTWWRRQEDQAGAHEQLRRALTDYGRADLARSIAGKIKVKGLTLNSY